MEMVAPERRPDLWEATFSHLWDEKAEELDPSETLNDWMEMWDTICDFIEEPLPPCMVCEGAVPYVKTSSETERYYCSKKCEEKQKQLVKAYREVNDSFMGRQIR